MKIGSVHWLVAAALIACGGGDDSGASATEAGSATASGSGTGTQSAGPGGGPGGSDPQTSAESGGGTGMSAGEGTSDGDSTADEGEGEASSGGAVMCPAAQCVVAPAGWEGPVRVTEGATEPGCGGEFPTDVMVGFRDLVAPPASCDCTCGEPIAAACRPAELGSSITGICPNPSRIAHAGICGVFGGTGIPETFLFEQQGTTGAGGCMPDAQEMVGEASWASAVSVCQGPDAEGGCTDPAARCLPAPDEGALCVYRAGESDCGDAGEFTELQDPIYSSFTDTRACSACSCGDPEGECYFTSIQVYTGFACSSLLGTLVVNDTEVCFDEGPTDLTSYRIVGLEPGPGVACAPSPAVAEGEAVPADPVTVCCKP